MITKNRVPHWYIDEQIPVFQQSIEAAWASEARSEVVTFKGSNLFEIHADGIGPYTLTLDGVLVPASYHASLEAKRNTTVTVRRMRDGSEWSAVLTAYNGTPETGKNRALLLYRANLTLVRL